MNIYILKSGNPTNFKNLAELECYVFLFFKHIEANVVVTETKIVFEKDKI
jgi:hypothetical protein